MRKYFGTDGVRGKVGELPITPGFVMRLGYAAGKVLIDEERRLNSHEKPAVLIGKDTRISGYMLEAALEAGFSAAGVDVVLTGPLPTPAVAYLTRALRLQAGVVISASHNPYYDNGIKFFTSDGDKLADEVESRIEEAHEEGVNCVPSAQLGKARRLADAGGRYIEFCKRAFPAEHNLRGLKIVIDSAHGAGYQVAPAVFHELGAEVISVAAEPDGININEGVGATHPEYLAAQVLQHGADIGISLDGDADRIAMVDSAGRIYDGDQLLYVMTKGRLATGTLGGGVVGTLMSNYGFELALQKLGVPFVRAKVGDRYVLEQLREKNWLIGGENSGHILALDRHSTGDAIIAGLEVLSVLVTQKMSLAEACADLQMLPQHMINVEVKPGTDWKQVAGMLDLVAHWEQALQGRGRLLLRASGTQPMIRVMVEANDDTLAKTAAREMADCLQKGL
jgi:phosphoglucosamine mutase